MKVNRIELIKFYDHLGDNNVIKDEQRGKAFRWIDNFSSSKKSNYPKNNNNLSIGDVSNSLPDRFWFEDEHGHKVTVIGYIKEWAVVEDSHHEEPYCLPFAYIQNLHDEMAAGNDC